MNAENPKEAGNSKGAAILYAILFVFSIVVWARNFETNSTMIKILRGALVVFFAILAVQNFLKYKRSKG